MVFFSTSAILLMGSLLTGCATPGTGLENRIEDRSDVRDFFTEGQSIDDTSTFIPRITKYVTVAPEDMKMAEPKRVPVPKEYEGLFDNLFQIGKRIRALTPEQAIKVVQTPYEAQMYHGEFDGVEEKGAIFHSFKNNHAVEKGNCLRMASNFAAFLSDNGYPAYILEMMENPKKDGHALFIFKTPEGFSVTGKMIKDFKNYNKIENLIEDLNRYAETNYSYYRIVDLDETFSNEKWLWGNNFYIPTYSYNQGWRKIKSVINAMKNG